MKWTYAGKLVASHFKQQIHDIEVMRLNLSDLLVSFLANVLTLVFWDYTNGLKNTILVTHYIRGIWKLDCKLLTLKHLQAISTLRSCNSVQKCWSCSSRFLSTRSRTNLCRVLQWNEAAVGPHSSKIFKSKKDYFILMHHVIIII